jgi:hypothetical protein
MRLAVFGTMPLIPHIPSGTPCGTDARAMRLTTMDQTMSCSLPISTIRAVTTTVLLGLVGARERTTGIRVAVPVDYAMIRLRRLQRDRLTGN